MKTIYSPTRVSGIFMLIALLTGQMVFGQREYKHFKSTMQNGEVITANLIFADGSVSGYLLNIANKKTPIAILGKMESDGKLILETTITEKHVFSGLMTNGALEGTIIFDDKQSNLITLTENYQNGVIPFRVYYSKSIKSLSDVKGSPVAVFTASVLSLTDVVEPDIAVKFNQLIYKNFFKSDLVSSPDILIKEMEAGFFNQYISKNADINNPDNYQYLNWEKHKLMEVIYNSNNIVSLAFDDYAYTGGSSGLRMKRFLLFDFITGLQIKLNDLFLPGFESSLSLFLNQTIRSDLRLPNSDLLTPQGFFKDEIKPNSNFYITDKGLGFLYNPYEIAPAETGAVEVFLPWELLDDLLIKEGGLLLRIKQNGL